jgi:hypothetical protein
VATCVGYRTTASVLNGASIKLKKIGQNFFNRRPILFPSGSEAPQINEGEVPPRSCFPECAGNRVNRDFLALAQSAI